MTERKMFSFTIDSKEESNFIMECLPLCKDGPICFLGEIFGWKENRYSISHEDYLRLIKAKKIEP